MNVSNRKPFSSATKHGKSTGLLIVGSALLGGIAISSLAIKRIEKAERPTPHDYANTYCIIEQFVQNHIVTDSFTIGRHYSKVSASVPAMGGSFQVTVSNDKATIDYSVDKDHSTYKSLPPPIRELKLLSKAFAEKCKLAPVAAL